MFGTRIEWCHLGMTDFSFQIHQTPKSELEELAIMVGLDILKTLAAMLIELRQDLMEWSDLRGEKPILQYL